MALSKEELNQKWGKAIKQCKKFRDEIRSYPIPKEQMTISYLFTQEDLDLLLNQSERKLNGVRAYIGYEELEGKLIPRLYMVGCIKEGTQYVDVVPSKQLSDPKYFGDALEEGRPCPEDCGEENELNS